MKEKRGGEGWMEGEMVRREKRKERGGEGGMESEMEGRGCEGGEGSQFLPAGIQ